MNDFESKPSVDMNRYWGILYLQDDVLRWPVEAEDFNAALYDFTKTIIEQLEILNTIVNIGISNLDHFLLVEAAYNTKVKQFVSISSYCTLIKPESIP